jgi:hypothetical protein
VNLSEIVLLAAAAVAAAAGLCWFAVAVAVRHVRKGRMRHDEGARAGRV